MKVIDLTKIPDEDLTREYMRRFNERRQRAGGRPPVLKPCKFCGQQFGGAAMRRHVPVCKQQIIAQANGWVKARKAAR